MFPPRAVFEHSTPQSFATPYLLVPRHASECSNIKIDQQQTSPFAFRTHWHSTWVEIFHHRQHSTTIRNRHVFTWTYVLPQNRPSWACQKNQLHHLIKTRLWSHSFSWPNGSASLTPSYIYMGLVSCSAFVGLFFQKNVILCYSFALLFKRLGGVMGVWRLEWAKELGACWQVFAFY